MYHPGFGNVGELGYIAEDTGKEYVELYNAGTNAVAIAGWRLSGGVAFTFPQLTLAPNGYLVVAADSDTNRFKQNYQAQYPNVATATVVGGWTGTLSNNGETIILEDNSGKQVDAVTYASEGDWALRRMGNPYPGSPDWWRGWRWTTGADAGGKSLELINPAGSNKYGQNWGASLNDGGTPGGQNSILNTDTPPFVLEVKHSPAVPKSTEPVTVTARVSDPAGTNVSVVLYHRLDGASSFSSSAMLDDGQHGDGLAGDGLYGVSLPAQADKTIVEFYVQATGASQKSRTWPAASDEQHTQDANALYQVDDSAYTGNQPIFRVIIPSREWSAWVNLMDNVGGGQYSDATMNATVVSVDGIGTEIRHFVGVRNRGAGTRAAHPHNLHINFPNDRPWRNLTSIDLNTRTVHSQVAGNAFNVMAGLPSAYGAPVQVRVNGNNLAHLTPSGGADGYQFGSYFFFQPYGADWLQTHFPTDSGGNIYKGVWNFDGHSLRHSANLDYLGADPAAYRQAYSPTGPTADAAPYTKQSNVSADDWSDLINLCRVLTQAPDADYFNQISEVANIDEWLNYFAATTLIGNRETTLGTGTGDDYSMYRGVTDPRFQLLPHDMDTTLGQGDAGPDLGRTVFEATSIPALNRFLKHPAISPRYYATLKRLAETTFSPAQANPLLDQVLAGWVPDAYIQSMKDFLVLRTANVLSQIPSSLSVTSSLPMVGGYAKASGTTVSLSGRADAIRTRSILVNGVQATWTAWSANWSADNVHLVPGINRIEVKSLDSDGVAFATTHLDVWYDQGAGTAVTGGNLASDTTWTVAAGPYHVSSSLTVARGATLTIQPGTTVYLDTGVNLTVADGGRILAEGTSVQQIRFASVPGSGSSWGGLTINGSPNSPETRLVYVFFEGNSKTCIEVAGGTLYLGHADFGTTAHQYVALDGSSFLIENCHFPTSSAPFELLHGTGGIKAGGRGIVRDSFFGSTTGYNDIMDFTGGNRPGQAIIQYYNNVFIGASDDILDLDGTDAWVEGNIFLHVHKNGAPDSSSAISGGNDSGNTSEVTIIRNIFYDCDQAVTGKQGNFYTLINNTIVHQTHQGGLDTDGAVVNLADDGTTEGLGMYLEGNIVNDAEKLVRNLTAAQVTFTNNLMSLPWNGPGGGNSTGDPLFKHVPLLSETVFNSWAEAQVLRDWLSLLPGSAALGTGPNGRDKGAVVPAGASISGEPAVATYHNSAVLTVGPLLRGFGIPTSGFPEGSGFPHYRWKLDGGSFSDETTTTAPITLTGLANGPHQITVIGKNDAQYYQNDPELGPEASVTQSRTWTVDSALPGHVRLNEILAYNAGTFTNNGAYPDAIELYNDGGQAIDLAGMTLSSGPTNQAQFVFPAGTTLAPERYLVVDSDPRTNSPGLHLGFGLNRAGDSLVLSDRNGTVIDSVTFGAQLPNLSVGRVQDGTWALTQPTLGGPNTPEPLGNPRSLKINEWLAHAAETASADFVELYNPNAQPVDLGGLILADQSIGQPGLRGLTSLYFIPAIGFALFYADRQPNKGANHLDFTLAPGPAAIGLFAADLSPIDVVFYGPQSTDISQGRAPNGAATLAFFNQPTPGFVNPFTTSPTNIVTQTFSLIAPTNTWRYNQTSVPGPDWINPDYTGDAAWPSGAALLYVESNSKPWPKNTPLTLGRMTYYFRSHFNVNTNLAGATLNLQTIIDDGAVFYLNGKEVLRLHMDPNAVITYDTAASDHESALEGPFTIPLANLRQGDNVVAVEVHQVSLTSSDIVFGMSLDAVLSITNSVTNATQVNVVLNEIMAHNASLTNQDGVVADWVELYNPANNQMDLSEMSLTDDPTTPRKWVFPANSSLAANGYVVVSCDGNTNASVRNTGFGLKAEGATVFLFDTPARGGTLLDSVAYGLQATDLSVGRFGASNTWVLNQPSPGAANVAALLGNPATLKINEWMANPATGNDWFELFNPDSRPVDLGGLYLTDDVTKPDPYRIPALSFIGGGSGGYQKFIADSSPTKGPNHTNFKLSSGGETISLLTPAQGVIDQVSFGPQAVGVSQGRFPDGSDNIVGFDNSPTPGSANVLNAVADSDGDGLPDDWELAHGLDPKNPADASLDSDGDGLTNLEEYLAGTDPRDPASALRLTVANVPGNTILLHFTAQPGRSYSVLYTEDLHQNQWLKLKDIAPGSGTMIVEVGDPAATGSRARFYRVITPQSP